jgi:hypothetical protein
MPFVATINVPGYLPMDDDPPVFESASEAWSYLRDERERGEDDDDGSDDYSETYYILEACSGNRSGSARAMWAECGFTADGQGTVCGPTPGSDSSHDLGLAYSVSITEEEV